MLFSLTDERDLRERGLTSAELMNTIYRFTHQTQPVHLDRPCTTGDGITILKASDANHYLSIFETESPKKTIMKFVPASGAASRMFKHIYQYHPENIDQLTEEFIINIDLFPFFNLLKEEFSKENISLSNLIDENNWDSIFKKILYTPGLNYSIYPKGLIPFHHYPNGETLTAFEEHIRESIDYGREADGTCRLHFTLAPHQVDLVISFLEKTVEAFPYEKFIFHHSIQAASTDTPAIDKNNEIVRDKEGKIIFRPAGHGALIYNLQEINEDIIFIKNIDNVTTSDQKNESLFYKKVLAGLLLDLKNQADQILLDIENDVANSIERGLQFIGQWFSSDVSYDMMPDQARQYIQLQLDRPMRVCGMVKNEGEPGGGPFWVKLSDGFTSKQIVEKSQIDHHDLKQMKILSESTHFNPVDIVCSIKNRKGEKYSLVDFIDHSAGFISEKFQDGKVIKALELPGLWNGSMALWNTVFVEVPNSTFNPVKTVNDLLRPGHQVL
jgi:hypothetical protein